MKELKEPLETILMKCITSRLPYGIKVNWNGEVRDVVAAGFTNKVLLEGEEEWLPVTEVKPYLNGFDSIDEKIDEAISEAKMKDGLFYVINRDNLNGVYFQTNFLDVLNENRLDYRQLIANGIAYNAKNFRNIYDNI